MSETAKPSSPDPQTTGVTSPELETTTASKSPSPPKSPFDDSEPLAVHATGPSSSPGSTSSPPVNLATRPPQLPSSQPQDAHAPPGDPRVAELRAIFPDLDDTILLMVLESVNGNQERAIEALLGMSDPDYRPELPAEAQAPAPTLTQEELDEQLARRLMIEEQEQQQARWYAQQQQRPRPQRQNSRILETQQSPPPPGGQGSDTMAEIQQSLTKAAEVGKKTLGDLFTKVKAKINEFEQGRQSGSQTQQQHQWAGGYDPQQHQYAATEYAQYQQHHGSAPGAPASYYDPNPASPVVSDQVSPPSRTPPPAVEGYDVSPNAPAPLNSPPAQVASSSHIIPSVPRPSTSPAPIDGGKLGLLPKRPVSLVRDPQPTGSRRSLDSDDGLEYAENPFEDQKK